MGYLLKEQGKFDEAEPFYRKALEGRRRVLGDDHPHTLSSIRNMGYLLKEQGKFDEAEILSNEALEGYRRIHGDEIVDTRTTTNSSEVILRLLGRRGEAQTIAAERGSRLIFGDDHPYTLSSIANMGFLLNRQGKLDEAEPFFREALEGRRRVLGDDHPDTLNSINNMGRLLRNLGRPEEAQALGAEAVERARRVLPAELSYLGIYLTNHSRTLVAMKRFDEAKPHALEGHAIFEANFGSSHKRTIDALQGLVGLYQAWNMADPNSGHDLAAIRWQAQLDAITSSPLTAVFQQ
jgi:non-specific serine/threonine protein kinase/serine/threonine-protein kinase